MIAWKRIERLKLRIFGSKICRVNISYTEREFLNIFKSGYFQSTTAVLVRFFQVNQQYLVCFSRLIQTDQGSNQISPSDLMQLKQLLDEHLLWNLLSEEQIPQIDIDTARRILNKLNLIYQSVFRFLLDSSIPKPDTLET